MGVGHVMRCLVLGQAWRDVGRRVCFEGYQQGVRESGDRPPVPDDMASLGHYCAMVPSVGRRALPVRNRAGVEFLERELATDDQRQVVVR